jgi:iron complex outermembrane recepter protein
LRALSKALAIGMLSAPSFTCGAEARAQSDDDILVTAQMRSQRERDVPIALSVTESADLARRGLYQFSEFARTVPGFKVQDQSPNNPGFVMRGITSDSGAAFTEPRVSVFQDGVSISKSRGSYVELLDLERIEVAKGPQSTLFGRGALIGAVNLIENKADAERLAASGRVEVGNYDARLVEAMVNAPLGANVALRLAGRIRQHDGTVNNLLGRDDFNANNTKAARATLRFLHGPLTIDVIGNYQHDRSSGTAFSSLLYRPTDPATGAVLGRAGSLGSAALAPDPGFEAGRPLGVRRTVWSITGLGTLDLDDRLSLSTITGFRRFSSIEILDVDGTALPIFTAGEDARGDQFSQEVRLKWAQGPLVLILGGSYFHEDGRQRTPAQFDERMVLATLTGRLSGGIPGRPADQPGAAAAFDNLSFTSALLQGLAASRGVLLPGSQALAIGANLASDHRETTTNYARSRAYDFFGDVTVTLAPQFELGMGLRYNHDHKVTGYRAAILNGRATLGGFIAALSQPAPTRSALLAGLAVPRAAVIPFSPSFPLPLFGLAVQPTRGNGDELSQPSDDSGWAGRTTLRYAPNPSTSVYLSYARGRRPAVLSVSSPLAPNTSPLFDPLPPETVDSYELGGKTIMFDKRVRADGAVYFYRYRDFQTLEQRGTQFVTSTAGNAQSYGFEGQLSWAPNQAWLFSASYAFNHARFKTGAYKGNRLRLSPDHQVALGARYAMQIGERTLSISSDTSFESRSYFDDDNDRPALQRPPKSLVPDPVQDEVQRRYWLVNGQISYASRGDRWRVTVFAKNLLNKRYIRDAGNTGDVLGLPTAVAGDPRFFGMRLDIRLEGGR